MGGDEKKCCHQLIFPHKPTSNKLVSLNKFIYDESQFSMNYPVLGALMHTINEAKYYITIFYLPHQCKAPLEYSCPLSMLLKWS